MKRILMLLLFLAVVGQFHLLATQPRQPDANTDTHRSSANPPPSAATQEETPARPQLPGVFLDTAMPVLSGKTTRVKAGGDLQQAIEHANCGDTIRLEAGATFAGRFTLVDKPCQGWIVIRTDTDDANLPPPGTRISPERAAGLAKLVNSSGEEVIRTAERAHNYRLLGLEIAVTEDVRTNYGVVLLGSTREKTLEDLPTDIVLDRLYIHGNKTGNIRRCIGFNARRLAVVDSYVSECHEVGADSQAVAGWNGPGPYKIVNNYLEGAGENVMFGGASGSLSGSTTPSDIEIRHNYFRKPLTWRRAATEFAGITWTIKNLLEFKEAQRVLVEGNIFENCWADAQGGAAILFTPRVQSGHDAVVQDITFRYNIVRGVSTAITFLGIDDEGGTPFPLRTHRILIQDNLFDDITHRSWAGRGLLFLFVQGSSDLVIEHNTGLADLGIGLADGSLQRNTNFVLRNNIFSGWQYGFGGSGQGEGNAALDFYFPGALFRYNLLIGQQTGAYPSKNFFTGDLKKVQFVDPEKGNYRLDPKSRYAKAGSDQKDLGADIDAIQKVTAGVKQGILPKLP